MKHTSGEIMSPNKSVIPITAFPVIILLFYFHPWQGQQIFYFLTFVPFVRFFNC